MLYMYPSFSSYIQCPHSEHPRCRVYLPCLPTRCGIHGVELHPPDKTLRWDETPLVEVRGSNGPEFSDRARAEAQKHTAFVYLNYTGKYVSRNNHGSCLLTDKEMDIIQIRLFVCVSGLH